MWLDDHPYIAIYLVGCLVTLVLIVAKATIFSVIDWATKANILTKNLKKLAPPDTKRWWDKVTGFVFLALIEIALSWINVPIALWQVSTGLFRVLRDLLTPVPEEIKLLRFPLRNNPEMPRELVWAYMLALMVKGGGITATPDYVSSSMQAVKRNHPSFSDNTAIEMLKSLKVLDSDVLSEAIDLARQDHR
jgi:hypothetical protein